MKKNCNNSPVYWKMRNGRLIDVDLMDVNHLRNVLKIIIRNNQKVQISCPDNISKTLDMKDEKPYLGYRFHDDENRSNQWN